MKKVPTLVSLAVVLAMALVQWRVSWPPTEWEESGGVCRVAKVVVSSPVKACQVLVRNVRFR